MPDSAFPGDVSVVGFDDIQSAAYSTPSLTTVRQPLLEMGQRGAQVLLERIANREADYPGEIVMAPEFVVRESTGPAPLDTRPYPNLAAERLETSG